MCHLPEKGRKEIEERVEEMKERDREERGTGMKVKKQKIEKSYILVACNDGVSSSVCHSFIHGEILIILVSSYSGCNDYPHFMFLCI